VTAIVLARISVNRAQSAQMQTGVDTDAESMTSNDVATHTAGPSFFSGVKHFSAITRACSGLICTSRQRLSQFLRADISWSAIDSDAYHGSGSVGPHIADA